MVPIYLWINTGMLQPLLLFQKIPLAFTIRVEEMSDHTEGLNAGLHHMLSQLHKCLTPEGMSGM